MKRSAIIVLAVATALVMALPATAKKPVKPEPEPATTYTVEIGFGATGGIATTCVDLVWDEATDDWIEVPLILTRTDEPSGLVSHFETFGAELEVSADSLGWVGDEISGCHGRGLVEFYDVNGTLTDSSVTEDPAPGYFRITLEKDGSVAMLWIFDVYQSEQIIKEFKKKTLWDITERTDFRMGGPYDEAGGFVHATWNDDGGVINFTATGQFSFVHFTRGGDPLLEDLANGTQTFTLNITLTPVT